MKSALADLGKLPSPPEEPTGATVSTTEVAKTTWTRYANAYVDRYGALPVRNAKVNGQIAQIVKRLGEHSPDVAAWYLGHSAAKFVANGHSIDMLLKHAEQLHTEWATGRRVTHTIAHQADRTETNRTVFGGLLAKEQAKQ